MAFQFAGDEIRRGGGGAALFRNEPVIVSLTKRGDDKSATITVAVLVDALSKCMLRLGDRVDIGIDPEASMLMIRLREDGPCRLHRRGKNSNLRYQANIAVREVWRIKDGQTRPMMPCTHTKLERGQIVCKLPDSWKHIFENAK